MLSGFGVELFKKGGEYHRATGLPFQGVSFFNLFLSWSSKHLEEQIFFERALKAETFTAPSMQCNFLLPGGKVGNFPGLGHLCIQDD